MSGRCPEGSNDSKKRARKGPFQLSSQDEIVVRLSSPLGSEGALSRSTQTASEANAEAEDAHAEEGQSARFRHRAQLRIEA
jgi:hypothetical protein